LLIALARPADAWHMDTSLRTTLDSGTYEVDPGAVAEAILRRAHDFGEVPFIPSQVLVPADLFEEHALGPDQLDALTHDHGA